MLIRCRDGVWDCSHHPRAQGRQGSRPRGATDFRMRKCRILYEPFTSRAGVSRAQRKSATPETLASIIFAQCNLPGWCASDKEKE